MYKYNITVYYIKITYGYTGEPGGNPYGHGEHVKLHAEPMTLELWGSHATRCATAPPAWMNEEFSNQEKKPGLRSCFTILASASQSRFCPGGSTGHTQ